jgi:hypothetical protein
MQAGLAEIQKNIAMLTTLTEPLQIVDKRRKQIVATVYPRLVTHNAQRLAGKYRERIPADLRAASFEEAREAALLVAMKEKYGVTD